MTASRNADHALLLLALCEEPGNQTLWNRFVDRYAPAVYGWWRQQDFEETEARQLTQQVLHGLHAQLLRYPPRQGNLRTWLRRVAEEEYRKAIRQQCHRHGMIQPLGARLADVLEEAFHHELCDVAVARLCRRRWPEPAWAVYQLTRVQGMSAVDAARHLGIPLLTIYRAQHWVQDRVREEMARLEEASPRLGREP